HTLPPPPSTLFPYTTLFRSRLPGRYHVVVWVWLLQHQPHRLDIIAGKAPIALCFKIPKIELVLKPLSDPADCAGDLSRDESFATARALMIEQNTVADKKAVGFAVVDRKPVCRHFAHAIGTPRVKRRRFTLRRRGGPEHLGRAGLIITHRAATMQDMVAH